MAFKHNYSLCSIYSLRVFLLIFLIICAIELVDNFKINSSYFFIHTINLNAYDIFNPFEVHNASTDNNKTQIQFQSQNIDFISNLDKYGLQFMRLSNNNSYFVNYISSYKHFDGFTIKIINNTKWLFYDCNRIIGGLGNSISLYWAANAISYWSGYNFKMTEINDHHKCPHFKHDLFTSKYLRYIPYSIINPYASKSSFDILILNDSCNDEPNKAYYIHPNCLLYSFFNPHFQRLVHDQTMTAFQTYFDTKNVETLYNMNKWDIVIHIRCGDILKMGIKKHRRRRYGFLTLNYMKYAIFNITKYEFGINDWIENMLKTNSSIWILSQLTKKSAGFGVNDNILSKCDILINNFVDNGLRLILPINLDINIVYDGNINHDYLRMVIAKLLICSPSTFCLHPAIANSNYVILPKYGPWITSLFSKNDNVSIIDNVKNDWYVSCVNDYKQEYLSNNKINDTIDIDLLSKYLCQH